MKKSYQSIMHDKLHQSINAIFDIACIQLRQNQAESLSLSKRASSLRLRNTCVVLKAEKMQSACVGRRCDKKRFSKFCTNFQQHLLSFTAI